MFRPFLLVETGRKIGSDGRPDPWRAIVREAIMDVKVQISVFEARP
jgi:hypothetical protein